MIDSYILLQVNNLRNLIQYLIDIHYDKTHDITLVDLNELDYYLFKLEQSLT